MLIYLVIFMIVGFAIAKAFDDKKTALGLLLGIAVLWGASHRLIWGFVTLGELLLGYFLFELFDNNKSKNANTDLEQH